MQTIRRKGKGMTDRLIYAWVNGKPAPANMEFPDERLDRLVKKKKKK